MKSLTSEKMTESLIYRAKDQYQPPVIASSSHKRVTAYSGHEVTPL